MFANQHKTVISDADAKKLSKHLRRKAGISNEDYQKLIEHKKSKASDLYKTYVGKFPNSKIAQEYDRGALGHGHFGEALFEGRYPDAMYRADANNLRKLKEIGIEHHLSHSRRHPDDESEHETFMGRYDWAKDYKGN